MSGLSPEGRDQVRAAAARLAMSAFSSIMSRRGETAEVLALVAEGLFAGVVHMAWRGRTPKTTARGLHRILRGILKEAVKEVARDRR